MPIIIIFHKRNPFPFRVCAIINLVFLVFILSALSNCTKSFPFILKIEN